MIFSFLTDDRSRQFCEKIVQAMELLYDIDPMTGCQLINQAWQGSDLRAKSNGGTCDFPELIFHEFPKYWAQRICNPNPCVLGPDNDRYEAREREARRRIEEYRNAGLHKWLNW
jgi:hypothetical protein